MLSLTGAATGALLAFLGSWGAVTPTIALRLCEPDPLVLALPRAGLAIERQAPFMLRLSDAAAAVAARGWPAHLNGVVEIDLEDPVCPWNAGPHRLVLDASEGRLEPGGRGEVALAAGGLALLYAGGVTSALLRRAGLLTGGGEQAGRVLDAAAAGPRPAILDYF